MNIDLAKYIDQTLLRPDATRTDISKLCEEAKEFSFFAVSVNPCHVKQAVRELSSSNVVVASVVGFPLGANFTDIKIAEAQRLIAEGAEELDMVINVGALKDAETELVVEEIRSIVRIAGGKPVKVIIECDLLSNEEKRTATRACVEGGASFVKTCSGFVKDSRGATVVDIALIKLTLEGAPLGIKASGGIKTYDQAISLIEAGATRIGTSSGVALMQGQQAAQVVV
jgi:deoxyribose-phosphate aldolase